MNRIASAARNTQNASMKWTERIPTPWLVAIGVHVGLFALLSTFVVKPHLASDRGFFESKASIHHPEEWESPIAAPPAEADLVEPQAVTEGGMESLTPEASSPSLAGGGGEVLAVSTPSAPPSFLLPPMTGPGPGIGTGIGKGVGPGSGEKTTPGTRSGPPIVSRSEIQDKKIGELVREGWIYLGEDIHSQLPVWVPMEGTEFVLSGWPSYRDEDWDNSKERLKKLGIKLRDGMLIKGHAMPGKGQQGLPFCLGGPHPPHTVLLEDLIAAHAFLLAHLTTLPGLPGSG